MRSWCSALFLQVNPHLPDPSEESFRLGKDLRKKDSTPSKWHYRGYLPHYDNTNLLQAITFRLADSLPEKKLKLLNEKASKLPKAQRSQQNRNQLNEWLDQGHGCCALQHPKVAAVLQESLTRFDGDRYELLEWVIMPNHVHVLLQPHTCLLYTSPSPRDRG